MIDSKHLGRLTLVRDDITTQKVDVIVNAANPSLLGGGGVDGAIHAAAGPGLLEETRTLGGCEIGQSKITRAYNLPAPWVVHTPGPDHRDPSQRDPELLASSYRTSTQLAFEKGSRKVAYASISTGIYAYPLDEAARIAVATLRAVLAEHPSWEVELRIVAYDLETYAAYERAMQTK